MLAGVWCKEAAGGAGGGNRWRKELSVTSPAVVAAGVGMTKAEATMAPSMVIYLEVGIASNTERE
jgi:hypothetical protein